MPLSKYDVFGNCYSFGWPQLLTALDGPNCCKIDQLMPGERLKTLSGVLEVESIQDVDDVSDVYNIEVEGEHVYRLLDDGILVHNADYTSFMTKLPQVVQLLSDAIGNSKLAGKLWFGKNSNSIWHTFRHIDDVLDIKEVTEAIVKNLDSSAAALLPGENVLTIVVNGINLEYRAFKFPDGTINVGRITN